MIIHLFNDGTGVITGTENTEVKTTPETEGILLIGTEQYENRKIGNFPAMWKTEAKCYDLGSVKVNENGTLTPFHRPTYTELKVLEKNDELENRIDALEQEVKTLKGKVEKDALDFLK